MLGHVRRQGEAHHRFPQPAERRPAPHTRVSPSTPTPPVDRAGLADQTAQHRRVEALGISGTSRASSCCAATGAGQCMGHDNGGLGDAARGATPPEPDAEVGASRGSSQGMQTASSSTTSSARTSKSRAPAGPPGPHPTEPAWQADHSEATCDAARGRSARPRFYTVSEAREGSTRHGFAHGAVATEHRRGHGTCGLPTLLLRLVCFC